MSADNSITDFEEAQEILHKAFEEACKTCGATRIKASFNAGTGELDTNFTFGLAKRVQLPPHARDVVKKVRGKP